MFSLKAHLNCKKFFNWLVALLACLVLQSCAESIFVLSDESPKPNWFNSEIEANDKNVTVVLSYYMDNRVKVELISKNSSGDKIIEEAFGTNEPFVEKEGEDYYPHYEKVTVNGVTEIVLHKRMEPVFFIATFKEAGFGL